MKIQETLKKIVLPVAYGRFTRQVEPPFLVYMGEGQTEFLADGTIYKKGNDYRIEYYFEKKDEAKEEAIEKALTDDGWIYEKSGDMFIESENLFTIYYYV